MFTGVSVKTWSTKNQHLNMDQFSQNFSVPNFIALSLERMLLDIEIHNALNLLWLRGKY